MEKACDAELENKINFGVWVFCCCCCFFLILLAKQMNCDWNVSVADSLATFSSKRWHCAAGGAWEGAVPQAVLALVLVQPYFSWVTLALIFLLSTSKLCPDPFSLVKWGVWAFTISPDSPIPWILALLHTDWIPAGFWQGLENPAPAMRCYQRQQDGRWGLNPWLIFHSDGKIWSNESRKQPW